MFVSQVCAIQACDIPQLAFRPFRKWPDDSNAQCSMNRRLFVNFCDLTPCMPRAISMLDTFFYCDFRHEYGSSFTFSLAKMNIKSMVRKNIIWYDMSRKGHCHFYMHANFVDCNKYCTYNHTKNMHIINMNLIFARDFHIFRCSIDV